MIQINQNQKIKFLILVIQLKKQTITLKLQKLKINDKYIDTSEFNKLDADVFNARMA